MSPTIQARAEAAAKEVTDDFIVAICAEFERKSPAPEYRLKCERHVASIIARHFADMEKLRAAAERAEKWFSAELVSRQGLVDLFGEDPEGRKYVTDIEDELASLRAPLTPDAAADGTKGKNL